MRLAGAVAAVTGASSGTGLCVAELAARRGAHVALIARDRGRLEAAAEAARTARRSAEQRVATFECDLRDERAVHGVMARISAELGPVDLLANCAGYCTPRRFAEAPLDELRDQIEANLLGTLYTTHAVVPSMIERGSGHIVNVASMGGIIGIYGSAAYSASKFGVVGFTETLRCELKPHGIGVTLVLPPNIDTPGYAREREIEPPETAKINSGGGVISPESLAELLMRGVERNRYLVVPGVANGLLCRLKGVWPELFFAVFDHDVAKVRTSRREAGR